VEEEEAAAEAARLPRLLKLARQHGLLSAEEAAEMQADVSEGLTAPSAALALLEQQLEQAGLLMRQAERQLRRRKAAEARSLVGARVQVTPFLRVHWVAVPQALRARRLSSARWPARACR
jgi:hypothetical protein